MEAKVSDIEARADAAAEMAELEHDTLEDEFAALEKDGSVDDDLAALKAKMSAGASSASSSG